MNEISGLPVIIFDDFCVLCSRSFKYILKHDRRDKFLFAGFSSVSSEMAAEFQSGNTVLLVDGGVIYSRSDAFIRIMMLLGGMHKIFIVLYIFPRFIRDAGYKIIARNRFRWWGRSETCFVPQPEIKKRFLSAEELTVLLSEIFNQ
jgi:predicted DCC family thiol-disulfide oxidoreductase YuxK